MMNLPDIDYEIVEKRGRNESHYRRKDGQSVAIFSANQHYKKQGKWERVTADAPAFADGEWVNLDDDFRVRIKDGRIKVNEADFEITSIFVGTRKLEDAKKVAAVLEGDGWLWYRGMFSSADVRYLISPFELREEIIFHRNPLDGISGSGNLSIRYRKTGKIDELAPFAFDARLKPLAVEVSGQHKLIQREALAAASYPVTVDPTVTPNPSSDVMLFWDSYSMSVSKFSSLAYMAAGHDPWYDEEWYLDQYRGYSRYDLSSLSGATVSSATHNVYVETTASGQSGSMNQIATQYDPLTAGAGLLYDQAGGTSIGTYSVATTGWRAIACTSYVAAKVGGFCDFGWTGVGSGYTYTRHQITGTRAASNKPYLEIVYTGGGSAPNIRTRVNGLWKNGIGSVRVGGVWKPISGVWIRVGGVWKMSA